MVVLLLSSCCVALAEKTEMILEGSILALKVFRYSFSEAVPIFFNRFKSDFILV